MQTNYYPLQLKPLFRYTALMLLFGSLLFLGFLRDQYVVNLHLEEAPLLIDRYGEGLSLLPESPLQKKVAIDPRWYNLPLFLGLIAGGSMLLARLFTGRKEAAMYVGFFYVGFFVLTSLITACGWAFPWPLAYTLGQHLKELLLSPLLSLLLLAALYMEKHFREVK